MPEIKIMTYHEIAAWRGISLASARKYAQKKRWERTMGNDGQARIKVPVETLSATLPQAAQAQDTTDTPDPTRDLIPALEAQIDGLKALVAAETRRAETAEALAAAETRRADAAEKDRDAWHDDAAAWRQQAQAQQRRRWWQFG